MKLLHRVIRLTAVMFLTALIIFFFTGSGTAMARAATSEESYTSVLTDLQKDAAFSAADYPTVKGDGSLKVIQIAEGTGGELFVYVYQAGAEERFNATTLRLSLTIGDNARWSDYKLTLLSSEGTLSKYLVNGVTVSSDKIRYYDIVAIHRKWISGTDDSAGGNNVVNEKDYKVGRLYTAVTNNGGVSYVCTYTETVEITDKQVGQLRYPEGYTLFAHKCDAHYVAFNTDKPIDKLYEVDVQWATQEVIRQYLLTINISTTKRDSVLQPMQTIKAEHIGSTSPIGIGGNKYSFKRIVSVEEFIASETDLNETAKKNLEGKKWVLRFTETEYTKSPLLNGSQSETSVEVSEVTLLRLKFDLDGVTYNLGVVDNKQEGSHIPDNDPESVSPWWQCALVLIGGSLAVFIVCRIINKRIGADAMTIIGSFLVMLIVTTLRITAEIYTDKFAWLVKLITPLDYALYISIGLFALFVLIEIFALIGRRNRRRDDDRE